MNPARPPQFADAHPASSACLLLCLLLCACSRPAASPPASPAAEPIPVLTATAHPNSSGAFEDATGTVRPALAASIAAKVSGTITSMQANPGRKVKASDVLAQIEDREIRARLDAALAIKNQAATDHGRYEKLAKDGVVTPQEFEAARTRLRSAQAAADEAASLLAYTTITAPFDGVITRRLADQGDLAVLGRPLLEMEAPGHLRLEIQVPESLIGHLHLGQKLNADLGSISTEATVAEISPASDSATRTVLAKLDLPPNPAIRSGQFGRARIPGTGEPALCLPTGSVIRRGQLEMVYVVDADRARMRLVRTGRITAGLVEVVAGLDPGEVVAVSNISKLTDGAPVLVQP